MFGSKLVQAGVITKAQLEETLRQQKFKPLRLGELLVYLGYASESTILRFLAAEFRTKYISTERLSRARISREVLELVPVEYAERYNQIPVLFDASKSQLSIVTSEPQNQIGLREVHALTRVREMRVYIALSSVVQAAIQKHYMGEKDAFVPLLQSATRSPSGTHNAAAQTAASLYSTGAFHTGTGQFQAGSPLSQQKAQAQTASSQQWQQALDQSGYRKSGGGASGMYTPSPLPAAGSGDTSAEMATVSTTPPPIMSDDSWLKLTRSFLERLSQEVPRYERFWDLQRPLLSRILRLCKATKRERHEVMLAFYLLHSHLSDPPLNSLFTEQEPPVAAVLQKGHEDLLAGLKQFSIPEGTEAALAHFFDRFDGQGESDGLRGEDIPLGARLLSLLSGYESLVHNNDDLSLEALIESLKEQSGKLFDGELVEHLSRELTRQKQFITEGIPRILLVDPDAALTDELESKLLKMDVWVESVRSLEEAEDYCAQHTPALVVMEVQYPEGEDGFSFGARVLEKYSDLQLIYLTERDSSEDLEKGISLARDYMIKPKSSALIVVTIEKHLRQIRKELERKKKERRSKKSVKGISGSLEQLGLAELLQVLSQGRRTGALALVHPSEGEGRITLDNGDIWSAEVGELTGKEAFYALIGWEEGEFELDPGAELPERSINSSLDMLILDGLRLLDEARRDAGEQEDEDDDDDFDFDLG